MLKCSVAEFFKMATSASCAEVGHKDTLPLSPFPQSWICRLVLEETGHKAPQRIGTMISSIVEIVDSDGVW